MVAGVFAKSVSKSMSHSLEQRSHGAAAMAGGAQPQDWIVGAGWLTAR
jgi:hypothetical protein